MRTHLTSLSSATAQGTASRSSNSTLATLDIAKTAPSEPLAEGMWFVNSTRGVTGRSDGLEMGLENRTSARRTGRTRAMQWGQSPFEG